MLSRRRKRNHTTLASRKKTTLSTASSPSSQSRKSPHHLDRLLACSTSLRNTADTSQTITSFNWPKVNRRPRLPWTMPSQSPRSRLGSQPPPRWPRPRMSLPLPMNRYLHRLRLIRLVLHSRRHRLPRRLSPRRSSKQNRHLPLSKKQRSRKRRPPSPRLPQHQQKHLLPKLRLQPPLPPRPPTPSQWHRHPPRPKPRKLPPLSLAHQV